ncbi:hypothetical protein EJB05_12256, partial [Eragrostis curvula]
MSTKGLMQSPHIQSLTCGVQAAAGSLRKGLLSPLPSSLQSFAAAAYNSANLKNKKEAYTSAFFALPQINSEEHIKSLANV